MYWTNTRTAQIQSFYVQSVTLFTLFTSLQSVQLNMTSQQNFKECILANFSEYILTKDLK